MKAMQSFSLFAMLGNPSGTVPPAQQQPAASSSKQPRGSSLPSQHTQDQTEAAANGMRSSLLACSCATPSSSQSKCPASVAASSSAPSAPPTPAEIEEAAAAAAELKRHRFRLQQAFASAEFATLLLTIENDVYAKCQKIARAVIHDAKRHKQNGGGHSSLNLNQEVEGSGCLLMAFIDALATTNLTEYEQLTYESYPAAGQGKRDGRAALGDAVPRICQLIRSSFDINIQREGWSALGWLANKVQPHDAQDPGIQLAAALMDRGCDVNMRRAEDGSTPLMAWIKNSNGDSISTGALFLLDHGADLEARDHQGNTAVHWMAHNGKLSLRTLMQHRWLERVNLEQTNNDGRTALQLAQAAWSRAHDARHREVCDLLRVGQQVAEHARPLKLRWLAKVLQIQDLAHIVMDFVDGKERVQ
jgi:hypothetical protein